MNNDKTIDALNELVKINNERIEGYEKAYENSQEKELKGLFSKFEQTSMECLDELKNEINKLGGKVSEGTNVSGKFFRTWMDVKTALTENDRKAILNLCEYSEKQAIETYQRVMDKYSEHLSRQYQSLIKDQYDLLKSDQNTINSMKNVLIEA